MTNLDKIDFFGTEIQVENIIQVALIVEEKKFLWLIPAIRTKATITIIQKHNSPYENKFVYSQFIDSNEAHEWLSSVSTRMRINGKKGYEIFNEEAGIMGFSYD